MAVETQGQSVVDHLIELRNRLLISIAGVALVFICISNITDMKLSIGVPVPNTANTPLPHS